MEIHIETLTLENAASVALLSAQFGYPSSERQAEERLQQILQSASDIVLGAFMKNELVGWMHVFHALRVETDPFCEIGGLVIDERYRGHGIGKRLVDEAIRWCSKKRCTDLRVRSNVTRKDAHRFYLNAGFKDKKEQKVFEMKW